MAPWLLSASLIVHVVVLHDRMDMLDLLVYREGAPHLLTGDVYDLGFAHDRTAGNGLPFTYPPFGALVLLPVAWLPWMLLQYLWQALCVWCVWSIVRSSLRLTASVRTALLDLQTRDRWNRIAMLWTAVAVWVEPVRSTMSFGQVNLLLAAVLLGTLASSRSWVAGAGVGLTAAVKLTPAISGLFFLVTRRFTAAAWSIGVFLGTVALGFLIAPGPSGHYWFEILGEAGRVGDVDYVSNQSLRGSLSRLLGYDVDAGWPWWTAVTVAAVLVGVAMYWCVRAGDQLGAIVAVQLFGLLVSPISWSHHWVWVVPALIWLVHHPRAAHPLLRAMTILWGAAVGSQVMLLMLKNLPETWSGPYLVLSWVYTICALATPLGLAAGARAVHRARRQAVDAEPVGPPDVAEAVGSGVR